MPYSIASETVVGSERSSISSDTISDYKPSSSNTPRRSVAGGSGDLAKFEQVTLTNAEQESAELIAKTAQAKQAKQVATWSSLPRKGQLALLTISRLSEPLTQTSLQSYMYYQLKSFDPSLSDSTISSQAGMMQAAFTATQFITAIAWGRAADSERFGRKTVLMIGLVGTMISALGFGFSKSFLWAMFFRSLGGALNGNVGVMRTVCVPLGESKASHANIFR